MTNDPRDLDGRRLENALYLLGRNPKLRAEMIALLRAMESRLECEGSVRDEITGPIVDALHDPDDRYERTLADGTRFNYLYRTKIAREFLMATRSHPTHVWEPQTTRLMLKLAAACAGDVLVAGAYFGDQAILVAKSIAPSGRVVHCFEPNADQVAMLRDNARSNALKNIKVSPIGLWSCSGVQLKLVGFDSFASAIAADTGDSGFSTVSIDDYSEELNLTVGLIQLDIEGAELKALRGAVRTLRSSRPYVVFEIHREYVDWSEGLAKTDICRLLLDMGYQLYGVRDFNSHHEMGDQPIELVPLDSIYLGGPPHGFNMLALPDTAMLADRGISIVEGVSPKLLEHRDPALHHPVGGL